MCYDFVIADQDRQYLLCHTLIDIWGLVATENFQVVLMKNHFIHEGSASQTLEMVQIVGESTSQGNNSFSRRFTVNFMLNIMHVET